MTYTRRYIESLFIYLKELERLSDNDKDFKHIENVKAEYKHLINDNTITITNNRYKFGNRMLKKTDWKPIVTIIK